MSANTSPYDLVAHHAWEAARAANEAFNAQRDAEGQLAYLGLIAARKISQPKLPEKSQTELIAQQGEAAAAWEDLASMAMIAMSGTDSIFKRVDIEEEPLELPKQKDIDARLIHCDALQAFFVSRGHGPLFNAMSTAFWREAHLVNVHDITVYNDKLLANHNKAVVEPTIMLIRAADATPKEYWLQLYNLQSTLRFWAAYPHRRMLRIGKTTRDILQSFIIGYMSEITEDAEQPNDQMGAFSEATQMGIDILDQGCHLFETVQLHGEEVNVVTLHTIRQYSKGCYGSHAFNLSSLLSDVVRLILPEEPVANSPRPCRISNELILLNPATTRSFC